MEEDHVTFQGRVKAEPWSGDPILIPGVQDWELEREAESFLCWDNSGFISGCEPSSGWCSFPAAGPRHRHRARPTAGTQHRPVKINSAL